MEKGQLGPEDLKKLRSYVYVLIYKTSSLWSSRKSRYKTSGASESLYESLKKRPERRRKNISQLSLAVKHKKKGGKEEDSTALSDDDDWQKWCRC